MPTSYVCRPHPTGARYAPKSQIDTLVVSGDSSYAESIRMNIEKISGFAVGAVTLTGSQSIRLLTHNSYDLVILDLDLSDMAGLEVCRSIRSRNAGPDIIAVTADRELATVRVAVSYGVIHYLVKPFDFADFRARLHRYALFRQQVADNATGQIGQHEIDSALAMLSPDPTARPKAPKGLTTATLDAIVTCLRAASTPVSSDDVARTLGISRVTARRYLERLAQERLAIRRQRYGRPGRPEHLYCWRAGDQGPEIVHMGQGARKDPGNLSPCRS